MGRKALQLEAQGRQPESQAPGDTVTEARAGGLYLLLLPRALPFLTVREKHGKSPPMLLQGRVGQGQEPL